MATSVSGLYGLPKRKSKQLKKDRIETIYIDQGKANMSSIDRIKKYFRKLKKKIKINEGNCLDGAI